jgi:hypothetical protein
MRTKLSVVCLLALAGTAGIFLAGRFEPRDPARPRDLARVLPQRQFQNNVARSVADGDVTPQRNSTKVHGVPDSQADPSTSGVAKFSIPIILVMATVSSAGQDTVSRTLPLTRKVQ